MKKYISIFAILTMLFGCSEDFLELSPQATLFASSYFQTEDQVEEALIATYDVLGHQKGKDLSWSPYLTVTESLGDDAYAGGQDAGDGSELDELNTFNISTGNEIVQSIWKRNYFGIYRANFTIEKAEALESTTDEFRNQIIGEAKFLRAYFYFELIRFFENVTLSTKVDSPSEANRAQAEPSLVYDQIATDLVEAIANLPESQGANLGRATKWAAKSLLGRVYLFENGVYGNGMTTADGQSIDATFVLAELEDVINNSGHALLGNYEDVFLSSGEFSVENVFEIVYDGAPVGGDWGTEEKIEGNLAAQQSGPRVTGSTIYYRGWSFAIPSHKLFLDMGSDPRRAVTILTASDILAEPNTTLNTGAYQHTGYYNGKYTTRLADRGPQGTPELHNTTNYRAIRFSDVLLMAAEIGQNVAYINTVRDRVGLAPIAAYSDDALFQERRMELSMEGLRYFDLIRRGLSVAGQELTVNGIIGPDYTGNDQLYNVTFDPSARGFLPIPQTEIDISNGVLIQNEGY